MVNAAVLDRWVNRLSSVYSLWPLLPAGAAGVLTGYLGSGVGLINQFGAFGWWASGLLGFLVVSVALALLSLARERLTNAASMRKWARAVDAVNPLSPAFVSQRINVNDIAHPITGIIQDKTFTDCELIGPAVFIMMGIGNISAGKFNGCDFVIFDENASRINNSLRLINCNIVRGSITRCTILVNQEFYNREVSGVPGANLITYQKQEQVGG